MRCEESARTFGGTTTTTTTAAALVLRSTAVAAVWRRTNVLTTTTTTTATTTTTTACPHNGTRAVCCTESNVNTSEMRPLLVVSGATRNWYDGDGRSDEPDAGARPPARLSARQLTRAHGTARDTR